MLDGTHYFECMCGQPSHTLRFVLDNGKDGDDDWPPTIYTEVMMSHYLPWYKRIWVGIKYMFGMETPDHYGGWELNRDDADRLIAMLEKFKAGDQTYFAEHNTKQLARAGWLNKDGLYKGYEQESGDGC